MNALGVFELLTVVAIVLFTFVLLIGWLLSFYAATHGKPFSFDVEEEKVAK